MSAIWGAIDLQRGISDDMRFRMRKSMRKFKIDGYREIVYGNEYFACGQQFFTKEAWRDNIPLYDEKRDIYFTADCVLNNRKELLELLKNHGAKMSDSCGDGELAYKAYVCWGEKFVENLRGSFAFAIYNARDRQLLLYADHFARRYLAYYLDDDIVCFSSVYQPILAILDEEKRQLNRAWIVAAYADCTADTVKLSYETVYKNIYQVEPGQYVIIDLNHRKVKRQIYWNPLKQKKIRLKSDTEYKELFLKVFRKAVEGMLRTSGKVGIMLSGGLDSSSVAALAATMLQQTNQTLYSYTAVPAEDYKFENTALKIENESEYIYAQQEMYPNIHAQFINASDSNCFTDIEKHTDCYREPVKPILNIVYSHAIMEKASADGCRIMLSGQNGNATISYGGIFTYIYQKAIRLHFQQVYHEVGRFCDRHHLSRKRMLKIFLTAIRDEKIKKYRLGEDCFLRQEDIKRYHVETRERKMLNNRASGYIDSVRQRKGFCYMPLVYQHMGFFDTYDSLRYGILPVDPTLTKEIVELCLNLPLECFVSNGKERRLIRDYMKGYVSDKILDNFSARGIQAADYSFRVKRDWQKIKDKVLWLIGNPQLREYLDWEKLENLLQKLSEDENCTDEVMVAEAAVISSLSAFLIQHEGIAADEAAMTQD